MSAILEEGIGFGGNDNQDNSKTSPDKKVQTNSILNGIKEERPNALQNAKEALEKSFPRACKVITDSTESKVQELVTPKEPYVKSQVVLETEKLITTFRKKMADYPKHMSYEGSMVLCVLLSMKRVAAVSMRNIPSVDQTLIRSLLPKDAEVSSFDVKFDDAKDFVLIFNPTTSNNLTLTLFNTVAHPRPEDLVVNADVQVESQGDNIAVGGGKIKMNRKTIQRLFGNETPEPDREEREETPKKPVATNRNAYEIRADVLQMAIDWAKVEDSSGDYKKPTEEQLLSLARKFYSFVENRR